MKKRIWIPATIVLILIIGYLVAGNNSKDEKAEIVVPVQSGEFRVEIETSGELEAKNSVPILGPIALRNFRIFNLTIQSMVDEGTVVKKGQWIATLDKSEFQGRLQDKQLEVEGATSAYIQVQLDTTLEMRQSRDELINLKYGVEEQEIILEQSKFEPPATIKQAEINLDKARRALDQAQQNYKIRRRQASERMKEVASELRKTQKEYKEMQEVEEAFFIRAPEPGMVIYKKGFDGRQIKAGSQINVWDPTVATLPDLSVMISKTYVNEVDVRKVSVGQPVEIGLDAFPEKKLTGKVTRVANVGEQRQNSDAKVFQVDVEVNGSDPALKPAMTTSNNIIASVLDSAMFIPLEALHSQSDSITYVYRSSGLTVSKQEVQVGERNADNVVILNGLALTDKVYLSIPSGYSETQVNLLPEMDGKRKEKMPEIQVDSEMKTITLPDGRTMTVPSNGGGQQGGGERKWSGQGGTAPKEGQAQPQQQRRPGN